LLYLKRNEIFLDRKKQDLCVPGVQRVLRG
jgi:hypothetical protein